MILAGGSGLLMAIVRNPGLSAGSTPGQQHYIYHNAPPARTTGAQDQAFFAYSSSPLLSRPLKAVQAAVAGETT